MEADYLSQEITSYTALPESNPENYVEFLSYRSDEKVIKLKHVEPLKIELSHFIKCIEDDEEPLVSGETGLSALKVALKILESARIKKMVYLEEQEQTDQAN